MIFIQIKTEDIIQVGDKTRIDATALFISPDEAEITLVEIEPEDSAGFIDVTENKFLDWAFDVAGDKVATVRVTTDSTPVVKTATFTIISVEDDRLFSGDQDILSHEVDMLRYLRVGRSSFLDYHRIAQTMILDDLDQRGITDGQGNRLTALDIFDIEEVREWSKYLALYLIFTSVQGEVDDVFSTKATAYMDMAKRQSTRATLRLDLNNDGTKDQTYNLVSGILARR